MVRLAFWNTVNGAYRFVFTHPLTVLRTGWFYLLLNTLEVSLRGVVRYESPSLVALAIVIWVLLIAASIAWHIAFLRAILLDERSWTTTVQFRRRHWRVVGVSAMLALIFVPAAAIAIVVAIGVAHIDGPFAVVIYAAIGVAVLVAIDIGPRLYLMAPAIAIDDPAKAIRAAWLRGRRNTQRLFFGSLLMVLPAALVTFIGGGIVATIVAAAQGPETIAEWLAQLDPAGRVVLGLTQAVVQLVISAFGITFSAFAYRHLAANWNPPPALAALQLDT